VKTKKFQIETTIRDRVRELRRVPARELLRNPRNWRRHPREQAAALYGMLQEVGYADALLARETPEGLMLIDGHLRAETTPDQVVPVLVLDVSEEEADKILLTLDPLAGLATVDEGNLESLMNSVRFSSDELAAALQPLWPGQRPELRDLKDPPAQIDRAGELKTKWGTEAGQAWDIGPHRLLCGDCREEGTVRRLWADDCPKLRMVWTDPPYGVDYAAKNAYLNRGDRGNRIQIPIENDKLTAGETGIMFKQALELARQFAAPGAACYATVPSGPLLFYFFQAFAAAGFTLHAQLTWVKHHFAIGMADYHHRYEPILYGWLPDAAHYFIDDRTQDDVFEVNKPHVSEFHPTTKPVQLIARMVANSSRTGELVYDPFCGSGSTLLAAHQLGRIGYGIEIDPAYVAVTLERMSALGLKPEQRQ
jgi:DNA modification methylase